jgi:hypothetical protein
MPILNVPVELTTDGLFAMRISNEPVNFFIIPQDLHTNYSLELVELTSIDDPVYKEVAVF